jgi:4-hydroxy-tetrahydrodipicolinate synthase
MSNTKFTGCGTALLTPFLEDGRFDEVTMANLVKRQVEQGIDFLVPCGTTGEVPTLNHDEKIAVVKTTVENAGGKPVLAGAGGYNTADVIELIKDYSKLGVDGILSVTPYYNKPTQEGVYQHYKAIAESTDLPIIVYSVQPRTNVNIEPQTVARLAEIPNIIGIKEASGNLAQVASIVQRVPSDFLVLSGDDSVTLPVISLGGHGVISVVSNQIPRDMSEMARRALNGDYAGARTLQRKYQYLFEVNFIEANPQPLKCIMAMMGLCQEVMRLPLVKVSDSSRARLAEVAKEAGLI